VIAIFFFLLPAPFAGLEPIKMSLKNRNILPQVLKLPSIELHCPGSSNQTTLYLSETRPAAPCQIQLLIWRKLGRSFDAFLNISDSHQKGTSSMFAGASSVGCGVFFVVSCGAASLGASGERAAMILDQFFAIQVRSYILNA